MKRIVFIALFAITICTSCEKVENLKSPFIDELTLSNYPTVDGSTSAAPLSTLIACKLLGVNYRWEYSLLKGVWGIEPKLNRNSYVKFMDIINTSTTHDAFVNLIDKKVDLILVARKISSDEKSHADAAGVSLIETPIALDAFIFIVHPDNPVQSLTIEQIQNIYSGKITRWNNIGGNNASIKPYIREANSGSQELMESLVMKGLDFMKFPTYYDFTVYTMHGAFVAVSGDINSICYTIHYYKEQVIKVETTKSIAVEGVFPNKETIGNHSYPFVEPVYAVIRSDLDKSSMAYKLYEWLQTEEGKRVIAESGYLPN